MLVSRPNTTSPNTAPSPPSITLHHPTPPYTPSTTLHHPKLPYTTPTPPSLTLHQTTLPYTTLHHPTPPYTTLNYPTSPYTVLHHPTPPYFTPHHPPSPYTALHNPTHLYTNLLTPTPTFTPIHTPTPTYTPTPSYTHLHQPTPPYTTLHHPTSPYTYLHHPTPPYTTPHPLHQPTPPYTTIHPPTPPCINLHQPTPTYTTIHPPTPTYTNLHQPTPPYSNVHESIPISLSLSLARLTSDSHADLVLLDEKYVVIEDGHWTAPYFDCGGGDIWMVTYSSPFFTVPTSIGSSTRFSGVATVDVELTNIDIDQCDGTEETADTSDVFRGTHRCRPTTMCVATKGLGFMRGTYLCQCVDGFYFPNASANPRAYSGFRIEEEFMKQQEGLPNQFDTGFRCLACSEGCETCVDDSPCMAPINILLRTILLGLVAFDIAVILFFAVVVLRYKDHKIIKASSPWFCLVIFTGSFLMCLEGVLLFNPRPDDITCMLIPWVQQVGFFLLYGSLLLRTWRISVVFSVKSAKKVDLNDSKLFQRLVPLMLVAIIYLMVWMIMAPPTSYIITDKIGMKFFYCTSDWWTYAGMFGQIGFLLWGVYLCYSVRKAPSQFNESRYIAWATYNTIFLYNFILILRLVMLGTISPDIAYLLHVVQLQVPAFITITLIFIPKVYMIRSRQDQVGRGVTGVGGGAAAGSGGATRSGGAAGSAPPNTNQSGPGAVKFNIKHGQSGATDAWGNSALTDVENS